MITADNQKLMADEGGVECLICLLDSTSDLIQRQSAKALANLGVNNDNKAKIAECGGIPKLVNLAGSKNLGVKIEAIAALANLAVNGETLSYSSPHLFYSFLMYIHDIVDNNEIEIVRVNGLEPIVKGAALAADGLDSGSIRTDKELAQHEELATQCSRALRNLSVNRKLSIYFIQFELPNIHAHFSFSTQQQIKVKWWH